MSKTRDWEVVFHPEFDEWFSKRSQGFLPRRRWRGLNYYAALVPNLDGPKLTPSKRPPIAT